MELMQRKLRYSDKLEVKLLHLCYYFSRAEGFNDERQSILDFKSEKEEAVRRFILRSLECLQYQGIDDDTAILRPLHSQETKIEYGLTVLDRLGQSLGTVFGCNYHPALLTKSKVTKQVKSLSPDMRKKELEGVYHLDPNFFNFDERNVLIIDDVITTGATVCAVISAILKPFPKTKISVFSLAWTPTPDQQRYMLQHKGTGMLNEPESSYGAIANSHADKDFDSGKTFVSLFA